MQPQRVPLRYEMRSRVLCYQKKFTRRMCILYNQRDATYTMFFIIISALHVSGGFFRPSSGAYKTVCAALGIAMLSCCLPTVDSRKA